MLKAENIFYTIGKKLILSNINVSFQPGEFNMILGPNGSGKSSFLKICSGETNHFEGAVLYDQKNIRKINKEELARCRAVMSQQPELSFPLMVDEVVMMGRYPHFAFNPNKKDLAICDTVIERMNLQDFKDRNYLTLSGGEKQRVQYARVLSQIWEKPANGCRYLFLDEPINSLDINYQQEFLQLAGEFAKNDTVLVAVLHDINLAIQFADKLFFLKEGELVAQGKPQEIVNEALIENIYGVKPNIINNPFTGDPVIIFAKGNDQLPARIVFQ
jgi:iron complex transport system ATP-binding protein